MEHLEMLEYRHSFVIRQEETVRYQQYEGVRKGKKHILMVMVIVTLITRFLASTLIKDINEMQLLTACTIGMALGLLAGYFLLQFAIAFNISQKYQSGLAQDYSVDMLINPGGIYVTDGKNDIRVYYDKMHKIVETSADFFVYPAPDSVFLIPKHQLDDVKKDSDMLREMFKTFAPENKLDLLKG